MSNIAIRVCDLTKDYEIYEKPSDLALEILTRKSRHRTFRALDSVSFEVEAGQVLGIIGSNGAGKSTLLKIITGVLDATSGAVDVLGRVTAILELGLGFNPEHSGRDNIFLSGLLYGMTRDEIGRKLEAIIDFSGLRPFIDQPVKTYSSGMHSRLAFSIATAVDPEILIIDEALAAGDSMFVQKCMRRIRQLCSGGHTVLVVSHGTGILAQLCQKVMWMEAGRVKMFGPALKVVQAYDLAAHQGADAESWIEDVGDAELDNAGTSESLPTFFGHGKVSLANAPVTLADETASGGSAITLNSGRSAKGDAADRVTTESAGEVPNGAQGDPARNPAFSVPEAVRKIEPGNGSGPQVDTGKSVFRRGPILIDTVAMRDHDGRPTTRLTTLRPFTLSVAYHCRGDLPEESLGIALAINRLGNIEPVLQWYTQFMRPGETRATYEAAPFRVRPSQRGVVELDFPYMPLRQDEYILSIGLLPNAPGNWEFYEYRHLFYPFRVVDSCLSVGAPVFFEPVSVRAVDIDDAAAGTKRAANA